MMKKSGLFKVLLALGIIISTIYGGLSYANVDENLQVKFDQAKTNLIIGNTEQAKKEFQDLESSLTPIKDESTDNKEFYKNILYNLGLTYQQKYYEESQNNALEGASTDDLATANSFFEKADPQIFENIASIQGSDQNADQVRAVSGIVGSVIKGKVKEWLKTPANCSCSFTAQELNAAGALFINLTESSDIPQLKNMKTRDVKIQEIFSRVRNHIGNLASDHPLKSLYNSKIKVSCKL